jgi:hypothetical protein
MACVDAVFGPIQLVWIIKPDTAVVLLDPRLNTMAMFSIINLLVFSRGAVNLPCF